MRKETLVLRASSPVAKAKLVQDFNLAIENAANSESPVSQIFLFTNVSQSSLLHPRDRDRDQDREVNLQEASHLTSHPSTSHRKECTEEEADPEAPTRSSRTVLLLPDLGPLTSSPRGAARAKVSAGRALGEATLPSHCPTVPRIPITSLRVAPASMATEASLLRLSRLSISDWVLLEEDLRVRSPRIGCRYSTSPPVAARWDLRGREYPRMMTRTRLYRLSPTCRLVDSLVVRREDIHRR